MMNLIRIIIIVLIYAEGCVLALRYIIYDTQPNIVLSHWTQSFPFRYLTALVEIAVHMAPVFWIVKRFYGMGLAWIIMFIISTTIGYVRYRQYVRMYVPLELRLAHLQPNWIKRTFYKIDQLWWRELSLTNPDKKGRQRNIDIIIIILCRLSVFIAAVFV